MLDYLVETLRKKSTIVAVRIEDSRTEDCMHTLYAESPQEVLTGQYEMELQSGTTAKRRQ